MTVHVSTTQVSHAWILLQEEAQERLLMEVEMARGVYGDGRTAMAWTSCRIRPGRDPAACGPGVQDLILHTFTGTGQVGAHLRDVVQTAANACYRGETPLW